MTSLTDIHPQMGRNFPGGWACTLPAHLMQDAEASVEEEVLEEEDGVKGVGNYSPMRKARTSMREGRRIVWHTCSSI